MLEFLNGTPRLRSREITIENTTFCNAHCGFCPRDDYSRRWTHMEMALFQSAVNQGVELGAVSIDLCGFGDPLMDSTYESRLEWIREAHPGVKIYTSTTGDLLNEKRLRRFAGNIDTVKFSHYGFSPESYIEAHGGSVSYERARANILRLLSLPRGERPYVILSFLVLACNSHEVEAWKAFWGPKADEITVWLPHNVGGQMKDTYGQVFPGVEPKAKTCGRPFKGNPYIRTDGAVSVCCFDFDQRLTIGNITKDRLADILAGPAMRRIQDIHDRTAFSGCGLICENCDQIFDRSDALVFSTNKKRKVGVTTTHADLVNDLLAAG